MLVRVLANLPSGPSRADPVVKQDALAQIAKLEAVAGRTDPQVEDIKLLNDGRELWLLRTELMGFYLSHHASRRFMRNRDANMRARKAFQGLIDRSRSMGSKRTAKAR